MWGRRRFDFGGAKRPLTAKTAKNIRKGRKEEPTLLATFAAFLGELCGQEL
jgi:hypothetical protein